MEPLLNFPTARLDSVFSYARGAALKAGPGPELGAAAAVRAPAAATAAQPALPWGQRKV